MRPPLTSAIALGIAAVTALALACTANGTNPDPDAEVVRATADAAVAAVEAQVTRAEVAETRAAQFEELLDETLNPDLLFDEVLERGRLLCAIRNDAPGWGSFDDEGTPSGFDIDLCRAVAAAVLGDADAVQFNFVAANDRDGQLGAGQIQLLARTSALTGAREATWGNFTLPIFYDSLGFMVSQASEIESVYQLNEVAMCVTGGTTSVQNVADFMRQNEQRYTSRAFDTAQAMLEAYYAEECAVVAGPKSVLAGIRSGLPDPTVHLILPEDVTVEAAAPLVPHGDPHWEAVVNAVLGGIILAEEFGVDSTNFAAMLGSDDRRVRTLLGAEGDFGQIGLGMRRNFMVDVLRLVGNYGEIYARHFLNDEITIQRDGPNRLARDGGLLSAPPVY